ncbi:MAG TPA: hypothetical protein PLH27_01480 [bacterium]|nr:hypothetical protein [bacterium]HNC47631.1 hypothetical protein [bacterium]
MRNVLLLLGWVMLAGCGPKEIPAEPMATITYEVMRSKSFLVDDVKFEELPDADLEPIVKKLGFTPSDYRHTVKLFDNDAAKKSDLAVRIGKLLQSDLEKASQNDSTVFKQLMTK